MKKIIFTSIIFFGVNSAMAQIDTSGIKSWNQLYNSTLTWDYGAFNTYSFGDFDYGWGVYNPLTHFISGDSIHIIKLQNGDVKQFFLEKKNPIANTYYFQFANLDGTGLTKKELVLSPYSAKNMVYYSIQNDAVVDREPSKTDWDFVLTKYNDPSFDYYTVTGFLLNEGIQACEYDANDKEAAYMASLNDTTIFTDSIAVIGKSFSSFEGYSILIEDTKAFFIKQSDGQIYRMNATFFESGVSGQGRVGIRYQSLYPSVGELVEDTLVMGSGYANDVYYSMNNKNSQFAARNNWDIGFKTDVMSVAILTNGTMGVQLYTYPSADASQWIAAGQNKFANNSIEFWPNPASDYIHLNLVSAAEGEYINFKLIDMTGRILRQEKYDYSAGLNIPVHDVPKGMYLIKVEYNNEQAVARIVVDR
jgi:Secretion system C-terminal sorting domain